jgi:hypothetical protein
MRVSNLSNNESRWRYLEIFKWAQPYFKYSQLLWVLLLVQIGDIVLSVLLLTEMFKIESKAGHKRLKWNEKILIII